MKIDIKINKEELLYKSILRLLNFSINLTENELDITSLILKYKLLVLNKTNRKQLRLILSSYDRNYSVYSINNYINNLKFKDVLIYKNNNLIVNPNIVEITKYKSFTFNFNTDV